MLILDKLLLAPPCLVVELPGNILTVRACRGGEHSPDRSSAQLSRYLPHLALRVVGEHEQVPLLLLVKWGKEAKSVFRVFYFSIESREILHLLWYRSIVVDSVVDLVLGAGAPLDWGAGGVAGELDCCIILPHSSPSTWRRIA